MPDRDAILSVLRRAREILALRETVGVNAADHAIYRALSEARLSGYFWRIIDAMPIVPWTGRATVEDFTRALDMHSMSPEVHAMRSAP